MSDIQKVCSITLKWHAPLEPSSGPFGPNAYLLAGWTYGIFRDGVKCVGGTSNNPCNGVARNRAIQVAIRKGFTHASIDGEPAITLAAS